MVDEGLITSTEAVARVEADQIIQLLAPVFDAAGKDEGAARRTPPRHADCRPVPAPPRDASPSTPRTRCAMAKDGPVILVRIETSPEDIAGMHSAAGILTTRGGLTSHAAVVARGMGRPCVVGAGIAARRLRQGRAAQRRTRAARRRRLALDRRLHRRDHRRQAADAAVRSRAGTARRLDEAGGIRDVPQLRPPAEVGRRDPHARRPHERRHAERRARGAAVRRARHRPLPHRAHVLRRGAHPARARDDPGAQRGRPPQGARRAPAVPEGRLRRDLPRARRACR